MNELQLTFSSYNRGLKYGNHNDNLSAEQYLKGIENLMLK